MSHNFIDSMDSFVASILISMSLAFGVALIAAAVWWRIDKHLRTRFKERQKNKPLNNKEYFSVVFGILLVVQGSAMIPIFEPRLNSDSWSILGVASGMGFIIAGVLLELKTNTDFKKSILDFERRISELEKECRR